MTSHNTPAALRASINELDTEIVAVQNALKGTHMAIAAVALAAIDAGAIERKRLIDIIESLRVLLQAALVIENLGEPEDAENPLDILLSWLNAQEWKQGAVLQGLYQEETAQFLQLLLRKK